MVNVDFSVIIPTYNRCYILWRAIQSVLNQTHPWFEILIIDDASTDKTPQAVKVFTDLRIKYHRLKKNLGPSMARNYGLKTAKGKYIAYLDSDNEWHKDYLQTVYNAFKNYSDKQIVFCKKNYRLNFVDKSGKPVRLRDEFTNHRKYFDLKRLWERKIIIDTNTMCHKKEIIKKTGGWDRKMNFWEDYEFTLRISKYFPKGFLYINRTLVNYEQTIDFSRRKLTMKKWEEAEKYIFKKHKNHQLMKEQNWYPAKNFKSTLGVVNFLSAKNK